MHLEEHTLLLHSPHFTAIYTRSPSIAHDVIPSGAVAEEHVTTVGAPYE
jgi:hypothetical protein